MFQSIKLRSAKIKKKTANGTISKEGNQSSAEKQNWDEKKKLKIETIGVEDLCAEKRRRWASTTIGEINEFSRLNCNKFEREEKWWNNGEIGLVVLGKKWGLKV